MIISSILGAGGSVVKYLHANEGDVGMIPGWGRSPREGNGNLLQYSSLENPMDRGAWQATIHGVTKCQTQQFPHLYNGHIQSAYLK